MRRACYELGRGGRPEVDAGGVTGVREPDELLDGDRRGHRGPVGRPPRPRRVFRGAKSSGAPISRRSEVSAPSPSGAELRPGRR